MKFKVGLKEELDKKREDSQKNADGFLKEAQLLLESNTQQEKKALRIAKLDNHIRAVESKRGVEIERKKIEDEYGNSAFTSEEIKDLCVKYDLRMLPTSRFNGQLDSQITYKLRAFIDAHENEMGNASSDFYVIAPSNAFDLDGRPAKPFVAIDPILVWKAPREDKYVYIHKWGKDFTFLRRLRGMFFESEASMWSFTTSFWIITLSTILGLTFDGFTGMWYQYLNILWIVGGSSLLSLATLAAMFNDGEDFHKRATSYIWNDSITRRR